MRPGTRTLTIIAAALTLSSCRATTAGEGKAKVTRELIYFEDSRPQPAICNAYMWGGAMNGGPALAAVDCESAADLIKARTPDQDRTVADVLAKICYVADERALPALCYAYLWSGSMNGGPALTSVPCDAVESLLELAP